MNVKSRCQLVPKEAHTTGEAAEFVSENAPPKAALRMFMTLFVATIALQIPVITVAAEDTPWQQAAQMRDAKDDFGTVVVDGLIYAVGGQAGPDPTYVDDVQVYDPEQDHWNLLSPMPTAEGAVRAAAIGRTIYVLTFGANLFAYDIDADSWTERASFPDRLLVPDMITVNDQIFVFGGFSPAGGIGGVPSDAVYAYHPESDRWSERSPMPTARNHHSAVYLDGLVYVMGGSDEIAAMNSVDMYDPEADHWRSTTPMPVAMENFGAVAWDGRIHALFHHEHHVYDPETEEWTEAPPMITPRHGFGAAVVDGTLFIFGGCYEEPRFNTPHNEVLILSDVSDDRSALGSNALIALFSILILASLVVMYLIRVTWRSHRTA